MSGFNKRCGKMIQRQALTVFAAGTLTLAMTLVSGQALAAAAQVHGQAAVVADYATNVPPLSGTVQGWRVPLGLTLEGRASNNLSLFLDLRYGDNQFPRLGRSLGNSEGLGIGRPLKGDEARHPFTTEGGRGERQDHVYVGFAYLQYASEVGLFRAGRLPRHWGLGLWRNAEWHPEGGTISTTDALGATFDLTSTFSGSVYWEKVSEGQLTSLEDDADAFTVEALLADEPGDLASSGLSRQIGIAFSNYDHKQSSTRMRILDLFAKLHAGGFSLEGEMLYPSGSTNSPHYASLGGKSDVCPERRNKDLLYVTCDGQKYEGFAALLRTRYQFGGTSTSAATSTGAGASAPPSANLNATEVSRQRLPTSLRLETHTAGLWLGYAKGDKDSFKGVGDDLKDNIISAVPMHPNIRPSLLMHNTATASLPGMPGAVMQNGVFVRGEYTYESPTFGQLTPAIVWGQLDATNTKAPTAENAVGRSKNLGIEFDLRYSYQTTDRVNLGVESGFWLPGKAWQTPTAGKMQPVYGIRTTASTTF